MPVFLDTEATGLDPTPRLVQLAYKVRGGGEEVNEYYKAPIPVSFGAMAVNHITNEFLVDKPAFEGSERQKSLRELLTSNVLVAHHAPFDMLVLRNEGVESGVYIDTKRVAQHIIESERHNLQYLRYFLGFKIEATAHDAMGDVLILEALFEYELDLIRKKFDVSEQEAIERMVELSQKPVLIKKFLFGKYRDLTFEHVLEVDRSYLEWLLNSELEKSENEQKEDLVYTLKHYLG